MKTNTHYKAIFATTSLLLAGPAALAADPETAPEDTWVSVSGKVTEVNPQAFELDHDSGKITVEFDDWDTDADAYKLVEGDKVTVTGKSTPVSTRTARSRAAASMWIPSTPTTTPVPLTRKGMRIPS